jgi:hypothetical protein
MTEILTESFCERCGTRYTFEPVVNRRKPLSALGTLGRGFRHFVSDPESSLDEAMAVARSETEQRSTASALEAFHRTFNFCLSCRQYTCSDCWNAVEGRCLSCAPTPDAAPPATRVDTAIPLAPVDLAPAPAPMHVETAVAPTSAEVDAATEWAAVDAAAAAAEAAEAAAAEAAAQAAVDADAATAAQAEAADAQRAAAEALAIAEAQEQAQAAAEAEARAAAEAEAAAIETARAEAEAVAIAAQAEAEARAAAEAAAQAEAERAAAIAAAQAAAEAEAAALTFEPGLNLDEQIAAYERQHAVTEATLDEPVADAEPEPEPVAATSEPTPAELEPIPTAIGQALPASSVDGTPSWPGTEVAAASFEPNWPDTPAPHQGGRQGAGLPAAEPPVMPLAARACPSCGLSLSASARFCRRCGTPQVDA